MQPKRVIVMAASSGLGKAIAKSFAQQGDHVAICSSNASRINEAAAEIQSEHDVYAKQVDVSQEDEVTGFIQGAADFMGGIDVLVTNAGGPPAGFFDDISVKQWQQAIEQNLLSVVYAVKTALPYLKESNRASISCIVSSSVKVPISQLVLSNALRPAIVGLAKTLSIELAKDNIRVNCIAPGRIATQRVEHLDHIHAQNEGLSDQQVRQNSERNIPMQRYGKVEEFANAAVFLSSAQASYITGQTIFVDGGLVPTLY